MSVVDWVANGDSASERLVQDWDHSDAVIEDCRQLDKPDRLMAGAGSDTAATLSTPTGSGIVPVRTGDHPEAHLQEPDAHSRLVRVHPGRGQRQPCEPSSPDAAAPCSAAAEATWTSRARCLSAIHIRLHSQLL